MEMVPTENGLLGGRVRLLQPARGYRVAVDAVLLAAAVDARSGQHILDLGAGVGAVGLCLAARVPDCSVVGIELQPELAALATRNATLNAAGDRLRTIVHDLAKPLPPDLGAFDHVVTNPPYLAAAVADNVFLLVGLPMLALWWVWRRRIERPAFTPAAMVAVAVAALAWTVLRNLPGFPLVPTVFAP